MLLQIETIQEKKHHMIFFNKEVNRMANKDDNVQPEVLTDLNNIINKKEKKPKINKIKQKS